MPPRSLSKWIVPLVLLALALGGAAAWLATRGPESPDLFASGNGRIEATEVNVATKLAGRLTEIMADEGDDVDQGQVLARMDTRTLEADLREARAAVAQAEHAQISATSAAAQQKDNIAAAQALVAQRASTLQLAQKDLKRTQDLFAQGVVADEQLDVDKTAVQTGTALLNEARAQLSAAQSAMDTAQSRILEASSAVDAAKARVETIQTEIDDSTLTSPISGRVLYRLAEPGEVLAAGGAVLTLLDITNVYMTIFLPTTQVGRVAIDSEARIVLDVRPDLSIPARVTYVSPQAQFTPKSVETQTEREKLMFRVKVRIDPVLLRAYSKQVKTGLPGVAHVRLDPDADWPADIPPLVDASQKAP